jgi:hypothetical protein
MGEIPSRGCYASARGLAKLSSIMANKGFYPDKNKKILSDETWNDYHSDPTTREEPLFNNKSTYTKGGAHMFGKKNITTNVID